MVLLDVEKTFIQILHSDLFKNSGTSFSEIVTGQSGDEYFR